MANEDKTTQDSMDARVLQHHLQTIEHQFWAHTTSTDLWESIVMGTWDEQSV